MPQPVKMMIHLPPVPNHLIDAEAILAMAKATGSVMVCYASGRQTVIRLLRP